MNKDGGQILRFSAMYRVAHTQRSLSLVSSVFVTACMCSRERLGRLGRFIHHYAASSVGREDLVFHQGNANAANQCYTIAISPEMAVFRVFSFWRVN